MNWGSGSESRQEQIFQWLKSQSIFLSLGESVPRFVSWDLLRSSSWRVCPTVLNCGEWWILGPMYVGYLPMKDISCLWNIATLSTRDLLGARNERIYSCQDRILFFSKTWALFHSHQSHESPPFINLSLFSSCISSCNPSLQKKLIPGVTGWQSGR